MGGVDTSDPPTDEFLSLQLSIPPIEVHPLLQGPFPRCGMHPATAPRPLRSSAVQQRPLRRQGREQKPHRASSARAGRVKCPAGALRPGSAPREGALEADPGFTTFLTDLTTPVPTDRSQATSATRPNQTMPLHFRARGPPSGPCLPAHRRGHTCRITTHLRSLDRPGARLGVVCVVHSVTRTRTRAAARPRAQARPRLRCSARAQHSAAFLVTRWRSLAVL